MASQNQINRDVERAVNSKGSVRGQNPINMLCAMVDVKNGQGRNQVKEAVARLEEAGKVKVTRDRGMIIEITSGEEKARLTEPWRPQTAEGYRQSRFAKGIPSTLPDDMCGPVIVTKITPAEGQSSEESESEVIGSDAQAPTTFTYVEGSPYHEVLTMCLEALRQAADEDGHSRDGVSNVLRLIDGMSEGRVQRAMTYLRKMNLYAIKRVAYQKTEYFVDMTVERITREMVQQVERRSKLEPQPTPASTEVTADDDMGIVEPDPLTRLAEIIESLEADKGALEAELATLQGMLELRTRERDEALDERRRLRENKTKLLREIEELRASVTPKVTGKAAEILERYR